MIKIYFLLLFLFSYNPLQQFIDGNYILSLSEEANYDKSDCYSSELHDIGNYDAAMASIETEKQFSKADKIKTPNSSWVTSAAWYSCDGKTGYFILQAARRKYLHEGVPSSVWNGFKSANSYGSFYDQNIRGRYRF